MTSFGAYRKIQKRKESPSILPQVSSDICLLVILLFFNIYLSTFIYLATPGLSQGTQDLPSAL